MRRHMTATMRKAIVMLLGMMLTTTVSAQSSTSLLNSYVQQRFDELLPGYAQSHSLRRSAKDGLTGNNLLAYDYLKGIIQQVAAGSVESTVFEIPLNEIMTKNKVDGTGTGRGQHLPGQQAFTGLGERDISVVRRFFNRDRCPAGRPAL